MSLLRNAARRLGLGKYKYYKGSDLEGNNFFEQPHPEFADQWRKNKRFVEYRETKHLSDYDFKSIPVQWTAWLRRTRREPPTQEELESDILRQLRLQANVARLEEEYKAEKLRLAASDEAALLQAPRVGVVETRAAEAGGAGQETSRTDGLPTKNGGLGTNKHAAEVAREIGTGEKKVEGERMEPKTTEEVAKERAEKERAEAIKRREEFARANPAPARGNPSDSSQAGGWSPTLVRR